MNIVFFILMAISINIISAEEKVKPITCQTSKCHGDLVKNQFLHSPLKANGCTVCHQVLKAEEPKSEKLPKDHMNVAINIGENQLAVCQKCHVEWERKFKSMPFAHSAIEKKGCTGCHNPHSADNKKLLREKESTQDLCLSCHKKSENWEKGEKESTHRAINVKSKCQNCHEVHASKTEKLLKAENVGAMCAKCHEEITTAKSPDLIHTPVRNGDCLKCHSPHYGEKEILLSKNFEAGTGYVKDVEKSFELCLSCHGPFRQTKFKNGSINLHDKHVNAKFGDKKHGCTVCDEVHVSTQHKLIKTKFKFNGVMVPLKFEKLETGGNCTTACHSQKSYDRIGEIKNKEGR